jgi:hypothetical protein
LINYVAVIKAAQGDLWWPNFAFSLPSNVTQGEREMEGEARREPLRIKGAVSRDGS